jgi:hypothetical protein
MIALISVIQTLARERFQCRSISGSQGCCTQGYCHAWRGEVARQFKIKQIQVSCVGLGCRRFQVVGTKTLGAVRVALVYKLEGNSFYHLLSFVDVSIKRCSIAIQHCHCTVHRYGKKCGIPLGEILSREISSRWKIVPFQYLEVIMKNVCPC